MSTTSLLHEELRLLYACERDYEIPAAPIVRQLIAESERLLPDVLPPPPAWTTFQWPESGVVSFTRERYEVDWSSE